MKKLLDKWKVISKDHTTYYWLFKEDDKPETCVSKCCHSNGKITYLMSNEENPFAFYGTEKEIEAIIDELEKQHG